MMKRYDLGRAGLLAVMAGANVYWSSSLFYPIQILVTLFHEICHGLVGMATGGRIQEIVVEPTLGGHCIVQGGWPLAIIPAGYLGSIVVGAAIVWIASRTRYDRHLAVFLGLALAAMTALYVRSAVGVAAGLAYGAALALSGWKLPEWFNEILLSFLGISTLFYGFFDIKILLTRPELLGRSDAYLLSRIIPLPPLVWAAAWMLASVLALLWVLRSSVRAPRRG